MTPQRFQRSSLLLLGLIVFSLVCAGCKAGYIDMPIHDETDKALEGDGKLPPTPSSGEAKPQETSPLPTTVDEKLACLAPPTVEGPKVSCEPCTDVLPDNAHVFLSLDLRNAEQSLLFQQFFSGNSTLISQMANALPERACIAIRYTAASRAAIPDPACPSSPLIQQSSKPGGGLSGSGAALQSSGSLLQQQSVAQPVSTLDRITGILFGKSSASTSTGALISNPLFILNPVSDPDVEEAVMVFYYNKSTPVLLDNMINALRGTIQGGNIASDGLQSLQAQADRFAQIGTLPSGRNTYVYQATKGSPLMLGTPQYLLRAVSPDQTSCLTHKAAPVMKQFEASSVKFVSQLSPERFQQLSDLLFVPNFKAGEYRHFGAALNLGNSRTMIQLKAFAGEQLADPALDFLLALNFDQLDVSRILGALSGNQSSLPAPQCSQGTPSPAPAPVASSLRIIELLNNYPAWCVVNASGSPNYYAGGTIPSLDSVGFQIDSSNSSGASYDWTITYPGMSYTGGASQTSSITMQITTQGPSVSFGANSQNPWQQGTGVQYSFGDVKVDVVVKDRNATTIDQASTTINIQYYNAPGYQLLNTMGVTNPDTDTQAARDGACFKP